MTFILGKNFRKKPGALEVDKIMKGRFSLHKLLLMKIMACDQKLQKCYRGRLGGETIVSPANSKCYFRLSC